MILLENYIKQSIVLIEEEKKIQGSNKGPTFGQLAAFVDIKNTIISIKEAGSFNAFGIKIKPVKMLLGFLSHYTAPGFVKDKLKKAGIDLDELEEFGVDTESALLTVIKSCEKALGFGFTAMNPDKILKKCYGINSDNGLERINMPANISKLIDDKIEEAFFNYLWPSIKKTCRTSPSTIIPENWIVGELYRFLEREASLGTASAVKDMFNSQDIYHSGQEGFDDGPIDRLDNR